MNERLDKQPRPKAKPRLGKALALMAGLAAASPGIANAQGIPPYDIGGSKHYDVDKKPKKQPVQAQIADSWKATVTPTIEDVNSIGEYLVLQEKLRGMYVQHLGVEKNFPQFETFCKELATVCDKLADRRTDVTNDAVFTPELFARMLEINRHVNQKIAPMTDMQQYGVEDTWTIPAVAGDCEDYVLLKIVSFLDVGFDPRDLHILVVHDEKGEGHAVLGIDVASEKGARNTLVLDNKTNDIIPLREMAAKYKGSFASFASRRAGEEN